jgi:hypothetical protein
MQAKIWLGALECAVWPSPPAPLPPPLIPRTPAKPAPAQAGVKAGAGVMGEG